MAVRRTHAIDYGFNAYETIRHLHTADLLIRTIPGETWTLSCALHPTLLVEVYTLSGTITGTRRAQVWQCGRLSELLLRVLWHGRKVQYHRHGEDADEQGVTAYKRPRLHHTDVLSDAVMPLLRGGDIIFKVIPGEEWRLTGTWFGQSVTTDLNVFHLAEESTLGTPNVRMYKGAGLEHVLLEFLCQQSEFVERKASKVLEFRGGSKS